VSRRKCRIRKVMLKQKKQNETEKIIQCQRANVMLGVFKIKIVNS